MNSFCFYNHASQLFLFIYLRSSGRLLSAMAGGMLHATFVATLRQATRQGLLEDGKKIAHPKPYLPLTANRSPASKGVIATSPRVSSPRLASPRLASHHVLVCLTFIASLSTPAFVLLLSLSFSIFFLSFTLPLSPTHTFLLYLLLHSPPLADILPSLHPLPLHLPLQRIYSIPTQPTRLPRSLIPWSPIDKRDRNERERELIRKVEGTHYRFTSLLIIVPKPP